jgi:hypothetical protein
MQTPLSRYWDLLNAHDWTYSFSDDHSVCERGHKQYEKLQAIAKESPAHAELYRQFYEHELQGPPWGTVQGPRPIRPQEAA